MKSRSNANNFKYKIRKNWLKSNHLRLFFFFERYFLSIFKNEVLFIFSIKREASGHFYSSLSDTLTGKLGYWGGYSLNKGNKFHIMFGTNFIKSPITSDPEPIIKQKRCCFKSKAATPTYCPPN